MNHNHNHHQNHGVAETAEPEVIYTCPMHPKVRQDKPGLCPECGMSLIPEKPKRKKEKDAAIPETYDKHAGHRVESFARKFWISLILTIPVLLYSELPEKLLGLVAPAFTGSTYIGLVFGSIVFFYGGWVFIIGAYRELKAKLPGMMMLIGLAISAAYLFSVYATLAGGHTLFWELTTLITVMLLGHWLEMKAVQGAQGALRELSKLLPDIAEVIRYGKTERVALAELREGDLVFVRPGGKIPADGVVAEGKSEVNESMVTGESRPVAKRASSEVIAGTINGDGALKIKVTKIGEHTFLAGVMRLVQEAQASKSRLQILSDRAAYYLTAVAVVTGVLTFVLWVLSKGGFGFALERMVAVLVIACPHALGLAIPLVASISTAKAAQNGFLVRSRLALEAARNIDTVLFDKTGTLTKGEFGIDRIISVDPNQETLVLQYSASVNSHSEHPIAKTTLAEAKKRGIPILEVKNFQRIPGKGVRAEINGKEALVGSSVLVNERKVSISDEFKKQIDTLAMQGKTINFVVSGGQMIGAIALADVIREESREAVKALRDMGVKTAMITGDAEDVAKWVASELKIDEYFARVLPDQKSEKVKLLQNKGQKVAMVGDGVNDAPALTQADLGVAIGAGTNVAIESAGIILVRNDPRDIVKIIKLSRLTYTKMVQNLFWATGYNIVAIPLAAGVLAFKGILLQPALAALFMSLSTVIVAVNAMLLRNKSL